MSGCDHLPPAPPLQSWSFLGNQASFDRLPVPAQPQVIQVGLCTTATALSKDYSGLIKPPLRPLWQQGMSVHSPVPHWQDWAWEKAHFIPPSGLPGQQEFSGGSVNLSPRQTGHRTPLRQIDGASSPARSQTGQAFPGFDKDPMLASSRPASGGLQQLRQQQQESSELNCQSSRDTVVPQRSPVMQTYAHLMSAILPSIEDGKLHSLVSQLRAALGESQAALEHMQARVRTL